MKNLFFLSIFFCFLSKSYAQTYEISETDYRRVPISGKFIMNLSKLPNNEYIFIKIEYNLTFDFSNLSYALKNETNFTNLKNVDFYTKEIEDKKTILYITFQKKDNFKFLLIYFFLGYRLDFLIFSWRNYYQEIPKYGSAFDNSSIQFFI